MFEIADDFMCALVTEVEERDQNEVELKQVLDLEDELPYFQGLIKL